MKDLKSFDELMPSVGIFWYDPQALCSCKCENP